MGASDPIFDLDRLNDVVDEFMEFDEFVFDVETKGQWRLDPRRNEAFWMVLAGPSARTEVIPFGHPNGEKTGEIMLVPKRGKDDKVRNYKTPVFYPPPKQLAVQDVMSTLKRLFFSGKRIIGANVKFDVETCAKYWGELPSPPYGDIQICSHLLDENLRQYSLGKILERELGVTYDKSLGAELEKEAFSVAAQYCHFDGRYTWLLWQNLYPRVLAEGLEGMFNLQHDVIPALASMEQAGIPLDVEAAQTLDRELDRELVDVRRRLFEIVGREWNFDSNPQKQQVFYGKKSEGGRGLKAMKTTTTGAPSCDEEALKHHEGDELVDVYLRYGDLSKLSGTYVKAYLGSADRKVNNKNRNNAPALAEDGRIHSNFRQTATVTGRLSSSEPNLQNVGRPDTELGFRLRSLFIAPPGHKLIVADYKQIEYVVMAHFSGDPLLIKFFQEGRDFHLAVAAMILGKPEAEVTKVERTTSKNVNFACVPFDTEALTSDGWKHYKDLHIGDQVMGYDGKKMHWTTVRNKVWYKDADVYELGVGKGWSARTTLDHRWDTMRRTGRGGTRRWVREFCTSEKIGGEHRLTLGALAETECRVDISPEEAAVLAWIFTDGQDLHAKYVGAPAQAGGRLTGLYCEIFQTKPQWKPAIDELLKATGKRYLRSESLSPEGNVKTRWTLDSDWMRDLWRRAGLFERSLADLVLLMDSDQRYEFVEAFWQAEGHTDHWGTRIITQCIGPEYDAIMLALFLEGYYPRSNLKTPTEFTRTDCYSIYMGKPRVTGQKMRKEFVGVEDVWCITTDSGNWVMRQNDKMMLTGNCAYGAGISKIAKMSGISEKQAKDFSGAHKRMIPGLYQFNNDVIRTCRKRKPMPYVKTLLGRKRRLPAINWSNDSLRMYAERQAVNSVIQGSAADINLVALVRLHEMLPQGMQTILSVHDEFVVAVPEDRVDEGLAAVSEAMIGDGVQELLSVPLGIDIQAVQRWSDAKG